MTIEEKIATLAIKILKISPDQYSEALSAGDIPAWDSLAHLTLLQAVEAEFSITFDVTDAIDIEGIDDVIRIVKQYVGDREKAHETCA